MSDADNEFELKVRASLDEDVNRLDAGTRNRLARMRTLALDRKPFWSRWLSLDNPIPATAFAAVAVLTAVLLLVPSGPDTPVQLAQQESDLALDVLFGEDEHGEVGDPDFYVWLDVTLLEDEEPNNAG